MPKHLPVICGETTCYDAVEKKRCRFVGTMNFGSIFVCLIYRDRNGDYRRLEESCPENIEQSMLLRLDECLAEIK